MQPVLTEQMIYNQLMGGHEIVFARLPHGEGLPLPFYATEGAAGFDLAAAIPEGETVTLQPGERKLVPTGLRVQIPAGTELQIRPRSGLALKYGITVVNAPGTVDCDYRGEIGIILLNTGTEPFSFSRGERIGQGVLGPYFRAKITEGELDRTERGEGGFGSTGTSPSKAA